MLPPFVKTTSDEAGIDFKEAEKRWKQAKQITEEQTGMTEADGEDYWKYVTGVFKKSMGISSVNEPEDGPVLESAVNVKIETEDGETTVNQLLSRISKAKGTQKNTLYTSVFGDNRRAVLEAAILRLPHGVYTLTIEGRATPSLSGMIESIYGAFAGTDVNERLIRGLEIKYPKLIKATFTLGLQEIRIGKEDAVFESAIDATLNSFVRTLQNHIKSNLSTNRDDIFALYDNTPKVIGHVPVEISKALRLASPFVFCGLAYFVDHHLNNHPSTPLEKYKTIDDVLSLPDEVRQDIKAGKTNTFAFIKTYGNVHCVVIDASLVSGKLVLYKTFFDQKREPYKSMPLVWPVLNASEEGDTSSIKPAAISNDPAGNRLSSLSEASDDSNIPPSTDNVNIITESAFDWKASLEAAKSYQDIQRVFRRLWPALIPADPVTPEILKAQGFTVDINIDGAIISLRKNGNIALRDRSGNWKLYEGEVSEKNLVGDDFTLEEIVEEMGGTTAKSEPVADSEERYKQWENSVSKVGSPTMQASRMIDSMLRAGFSRSEFSVKTERSKTGEYGDAVVSGPLSPEIYEKTEALLKNGLSVYWYGMEGRETPLATIEPSGGWHRAEAHKQYAGSGKLTVVNQSSERRTFSVDQIEDAKRWLAMDKVVLESTPTPEEIHDAAHEAATSHLNDLPQPTEAQKKSGTYKMGHLILHGLSITIENPRGSTRRGVAQDGTAWESTMNAHYGYIKGTVGRDKDHLDCFIGDNPESEAVFVVDQIDPATGRMDEHKIMIGYENIEEARAAYLANYDDTWQGLGAITGMTMDEFKIWLSEGDLKQPLDDSILEAA